jgi:hypothetical protein
MKTIKGRRSSLVRFIECLSLSDRLHFLELQAETRAVILVEHSATAV